METTNDSTFESRARGCILGALCGDAIGGVLEH
jgi:ADP-ribosyl-[dinitrogen reductase] hydrolase